MMYMPVYITYGESVKFELAVQELLPVLQYMIWHLSTTRYYIRYMYGVLSRA